LEKLEEGVKNLKQFFDKRLQRFLLAKENIKLKD
jgi:hypothetical protein